MIKLYNELTKENKEVYLLNLPNTLTVIRFFLIPLFIFVFFSHLKFNYIIAIVIFLLSGITDILDGYIARKYNMVTKFGKLFDPFADKLMIIGVLWCLETKKFIPSIILYIVLLKELVMIVGSLFLYRRINLVVSSNIYGKISTFLFYVAIILLLLKIRISLYFLIVAVIFALFALIVYSVKYISEYRRIKGTSNE